MLLHRVSCEVETALPLPGVRGFRRQLLQLLTHLVTNSVEAMAGVQQRERRLRVLARQHDARAVAICVEDSGVGIEPQHAARIFEPFFTTKPYRSGLGLAICRHIVDAHGGHISVAAGDDGGAAFMVVLPAGS
jgi:two-component system sensor kinase FixL